MKSIKLLLLLLISVALAALILTGCPEDPQEPPPPLVIEVTGLDITNSSAILVVGTTEQLEYTMTPENANTGLTWSSSDEGVATVSQGGLITGVAEGEATITLASTINPSINDTCEVTVTESIQQLNDFFLFNQDAAGSADGTTTELPGMVDDRLVITNSGDARIDSDEFHDNTMVLYNTQFTTPFRIRARICMTAAAMSSSARGITIGAYTADAISGTLNAGKLSAIMMRTNGDIRAYYSKDEGENGTGSPSLSTDENGPYEYIFEVQRTEGGYYFGVFNSNSGELVAENTVVNDEFDPVVTGTTPVYLGFSVGVSTATISNIKIYSGTVGVDETLLFESTEIAGTPVPVTGVTVTGPVLNADPPYNYQNTLAAAMADTIQLTADVAPATADDPSVTWSSSDDSIAEVDENGLVTVLTAGDVEITATTNDNGFTGSYRMLITEGAVLVTDIIITGATTVMEGLATTLGATVEPSNATDQTVSWSSSNTDIATVDQDTGVVLSVAVGTVTITATANDGSGISSGHDIEVTAAVGMIFIWSIPTVFDAYSAPTTVDGYTVTFRDDARPAVSTSGIDMSESTRFCIGTHHYDDDEAGATVIPDVSVTTLDQNVPDGEFNFTLPTTVTITYTDWDQVDDTFYVYVNNNTTGSSNSVLGGDSRISPNEALDPSGSGTCTFSINPEDFDDPTVSLAAAFIQIRTDSDTTLTMTSIQIAYD